MFASSAEASTLCAATLALMLSSAAAPLSRLRHTMWTLAPRVARLSAVALPMPELAPVTTAVFPTKLTLMSASFQQRALLSFTPSFVCVGSRKYWSAPRTLTRPMPACLLRGRSLPLLSVTHGSCSRRALLACCLWIRAVLGHVLKEISPFGWDDPPTSGSEHPSFSFGSKERESS